MGFETEEYKKVNEIAKDIIFPYGI